VLDGGGLPGYRGMRAHAKQLPLSSVQFSYVSYPFAARYSHWMWHFSRGLQRARSRATSELACQQALTATIVLSRCAGHCPTQARTHRKSAR
jgi:hypothetical protein